ncbi:MAG: hypothetical protein WBA48_19055, partial [Xanthobacteraceae bacterium]
GRSRSKNGVASLAYVPAIHVFRACCVMKTWMAGVNPAMTKPETLSNDSWPYATVAGGSASTE